MKVIKKPKLPLQTCKLCGAVLKVELKDLKTNGFVMAKTDFVCKVCKATNEVKFEKGEE